jgi:hypothetical protein
MLDIRWRVDIAATISAVNQKGMHGLRECEAFPSKEASDGQGGIGRRGRALSSVQPQDAWRLRRHRVHLIVFFFDRGNRPH